MTAPAFDKWPPAGLAYQAYQNGRGQTLTRELVIAEYTAKHGQPPAEVWYCKPFLWLAGPVPEPEAPPTVEAVPAPELISGDAIDESLMEAGLLPDPDERTETALALDGQTRFL